MNQRLIHDVAWAASLSIMEVIEAVLLPNERKDCFSEVYERVRAGIEAFCIEEQRERARLCKPSRN